MVAFAWYGQTRWENASEDGASDEAAPAAAPAPAPMDAESDASSAAAPAPILSDDESYDDDDGVPEIPGTTI